MSKTRLIIPLLLAFSLLGSTNTAIGQILNTKTSCSDPSDTRGFFFEDSVNDSGNKVKLWFSKTRSCSSSSGVSGKKVAGKVSSRVVVDREVCSFAGAGAGGVALGSIGKCLTRGVGDYASKCQGRVKDGSAVTFKPTVKQDLVNGVWQSTGLSQVLYCPKEISSKSVVDVSEFTTSDLVALGLDSGVAQVGPLDGWLPVRMLNVAYTTTTTQSITTTLNDGTVVNITAVPSEFIWDFGDGTVINSGDDPGKPYPDHSVYMQYTVIGDYQPVLTINWQATYQTSNDPMPVVFEQPITTTINANPLTIGQLRTTLTTTQNEKQK